jgi:hypothetical protein
MPLGGLGMTESQIWCSADSMINVYGSNAAMQAAMMAGKMLARKDQTGYESWKRITRAIRRIESGQLFAN